MVESRKYTHEGDTVYAVATATTARPAEQPAHAEFVGLVCFRQPLHAGTEVTAKRLRELGCTIAYAFSDSSARVSSLAHRAGVTPFSGLPTTTISHRIILGQTLYTELSDTERRRLVPQLDPDTTIVVTQPLPEFYEQFIAI